MQMSAAGITRRQLIARGVGLSAAAGATMLAAGCRPGEPVDGPGSTTGSSSTGTARVGIRPSYVPFDGPVPDLPGDATIGVPHGFLKYPDPAASTGRVPLNLSAPVEFMVQGVPPGVPAERNARWKQMEADLGTSFRINAVDSTQYTAKFQTAIAGNALAEITQITAVPQLPKVLESMFTDLTPYLSGDNVKKYPNLANMPSAAWDVCTVDGRIWGLTNPRVIAGTVLMTRGDILQQKGIDTMPSLGSGEDFLDLCREVTDASNGIFAIGQLPQNWTVPVIVEALGGPNAWQVENGTWISAYESPEYERALEIVTAMFAERLIHPNSYSDVSSSVGWFDQGVTALFAQNFSAWHTRAGRAAFPCGAVVMPKWDGGGVARKHLGPPGYVDVVGLRRTDDAARIEELLRVGDYLASPFGTSEYSFLNYGIRDRHYTVTDGQIALIPDAPIEGFSGPAYFGNMGSVNIYAPNRPEATKLVHDYCRTMIPDGVANPVYGKFSETAVSKQAAADRVLNDVMAGIIQGRQSLSTWAAAVQAWKQQAGDAMAREYAAS